MVSGAAVYDGAGRPPISGLPGQTQAEYFATLPICTNKDNPRIITFA
jgi:hypothetical protein